MKQTPRSPLATYYVLRTNSRGITPSHEMPLAVKEVSKDTGQQAVTNALLVLPNIFSARTKASRVRGITLIDTLVGAALMLIVFMGIAAAFNLSIDVVISNKARAGAIALANERMEYIRSLPYTSIGTSGGIPSGAIAQTESLAFNGVSYIRRTLVEFMDDSKDGSGGSDTTGIADYKAVKVEVSWTSRTGARSVFLVSRFEPQSGLESSVTGGLLSINVVNSSNEPVASAQVTITNSGVSPAVNLTTYTNASGNVTLLGVTAGSGYGVSVTKSGYSTSRTYSSTAQNPNPSPANLTVSNNQTTSSTFAIDQTGTLTIITLPYGGGSPITSVPVTVTGSKTTGTNPTTYKYSGAVGGTGSATTTLSSMEYDTYTMYVNPSTGYDLASSCSPQPIALSPGTSVTTTLYLAPHASNSLPVKVSAASTGALLSGASVRLYKSGYDTTQATDSCGQTFFSGLTAGTYSMSVSASGYTSFSGASVTVNATSSVYAVSLN